MIQKILLFFHMLDKTSFLVLSIISLSSNCFSAFSKNLLNPFIFPYVDKILDALIKGQRFSECKHFLRIAITRNQEIQKLVQNLYNKGMAMCRDYFSDYEKKEIYNEKFFKKETLYGYYFFPESGFIAFSTPYYIQTVTYFVTNIAKVTQNSSDTEVQCLINELNKTYDFFINYLSEKEGKQDESHL